MKEYIQSVRVWLIVDGFGWFWEYQTNKQFNSDTRFNVLPYSNNAHSQTCATVQSGWQLAQTADQYNTFRTAIMHTARPVPLCSLAGS